MTKKSIILMALLLICSFSHADTLQRFINAYKEKDGARHKVLNRDSHFNDVPDGSISPFSMKLSSGTLKVMGIEEMLILQLDSCRESVRKQFVNKVYEAIPTDYSLLTDKKNYRIYMSNSDEEYAYVLIVNNKLPGLTLMYVTNGFIRALVNDTGDGVDLDKLGDYFERGAEKFGESMIGVGEKVKEGFQRLKERAKEWDEELEEKDSYYYF